MPEPVLPGFHYDIGKARVLAEAAHRTWSLAEPHGPVPPDRLAAVGLLAAQVIVSSGMRADPDAALRALVAFVLELVPPGPGRI